MGLDRFGGGVRQEGFDFITLAGRGSGVVSLENMIGVESTNGTRHAVAPPSL